MVFFTLTAARPERPALQNVNNIRNPCALNVFMFVLLLRPSRQFPVSGRGSFFVFFFPPDMLTVAK